MNNRYESKTGLFLIELIIVILFFSIASAICVQVFVKSHIISQHTSNSNHAMILSQDVSEIFYYSNGDFQLTKTFFPQSISKSQIWNYSDNDHFIIYYDNNWNITNDPNAYSYILIALFTEDSDFHHLDVSISQYNEDLFQSASYNDYLAKLDDTHLWNYHFAIEKYKQKGISHEKTA